MNAALLNHAAPVTQVVRIMRQMTAILVAFVVLAHAIMGCQWHHGDICRPGTPKVGAAGGGGKIQGIAKSGCRGASRVLEGHHHDPASCDGEVGHFHSADGFRGDPSPHDEPCFAATCQWLPANMVKVWDERLSSHVLLCAHEPCVRQSVRIAESRREAQAVLSRADTAVAILRL